MLLEQGYPPTHILEDETDKSEQRSLAARFRGFLLRGFLCWIVVMAGVLTIAYHMHFGASGQLSAQDDNHLMGLLFASVPVTLVLMHVSRRILRRR